MQHVPRWYTHARVYIYIYVLLIISGIIPLKGNGSGQILLLCMSVVTRDESETSVRKLNPRISL